MHVKLLQSYRYPKRGAWRTVEIEMPKLRDIESAVKRLNRNEYPYLWLLHERCDDDVPDDFMSIMGGDGEYAITHYIDGDEFHYIDDSRDPNEHIQIWSTGDTSEQPAKYLCGNTKLVCNIAKLFAKTGDRLKDVDWYVSLG